MFSKNTDVSGFMTLLPCEKIRCTVRLRNIIDIKKMIEAGARVIAHEGCIKRPNSNETEIDIQSFRLNGAWLKINLISRCFR